MLPAPWGSKGEGNSQPLIAAFQKWSRDWGGRGGAPAIAVAELRWQQGGGAAGQAPCQVCDTDWSPAARRFSRSWMCLIIMRQEWGRAWALSLLPRVKPTPKPWYRDHGLIAEVRSIVSPTEMTPKCSSRQPSLQEMIHHGANSLSGLIMTGLYSVLTDFFSSHGWIIFYVQVFLELEAWIP